MILPLSDAPNPRGVPAVTYALIVINVVVYLFWTLPLSQQRPSVRDPMLAEYVRTVRQSLPPEVPLDVALRGLSAYDLFVFKHGFRPGAPEPRTLLTSIFLHGGFMHLFGNMLFLWIYGDNVEYRLGRWRYALYYLLTGVVATLVYSLFALGSRLPLVGASGAISGVLGFYFLWFPRNTVRLFVFLFPFFMNVVEIPARIVLGFYLLIDNLLPLLLAPARSGGGVAHGAHIGGFVAGLAAAAWMNRRELRVSPGEYGTVSAATAGSPGESVAEAIARDAMEEAAQTYFALGSEATRGLLKPDESLALANWLAAHSHAPAALTVYRRHLRDYPAGPGTAEAHLGAGFVQLERLGQVAPAYQHFLEALDANPSPATRQRARAALEAIVQRQKYPFRRYINHE